VLFIFTRTKLKWVNSGKCVRFSLGPLSLPLSLSFTASGSGTVLEKYKKSIRPKAVISQKTSLTGWSSTLRILTKAKWKQNYRGKKRRN